MRVIVGLALALSLASFGCSGGGDPEPSATPTPVTFELSLSSATLDIRQGQSASVTVLITRTSTTTAPVTITASGLASGISAAPLTIDESSTSGELVISASLGAAQTTSGFDAVVGGSGGGGSDSAPLHVTVRGAPGAIDTTFAGGGQRLDFVDGDQPRDIALQSDGKIVVVGSADFRVALARLLSDGALDSSFTNGLIGYGSGGGGCGGSGIAIAPDDKVYVAGFAVLGLNGDEDSLVARRTSAGANDGTFPPSITDAGASFGYLDNYDVNLTIQLLPDSKIITGTWGNDDSVPANDYIAVSRLNANGSVDSSFGTNGRAMVPQLRYLRETAVTSTGGVLALGGMATGIGIARFTNDGILDSTFSGTGLVTTTVGLASIAGDFAVQQDGKIVIAGTTAPTVTEEDVFLLRLNPDGSFDQTFGAGGIAMIDVGQYDEPDGVVLQADGTIIVSFLRADPGDADIVVARTLPTGALDPSFNGVGYQTIDFLNEQDRPFGLVVQADGRIVVLGQFYSTSTSEADFTVTRLWQ